VFRTIRWKLIVSSLLAVGIPLVLVSILLAHLLWQFYLRQLERELNTQAFIIADAAVPHLPDASDENRRALLRMIYHWRLYSNVRVTIVDAQGIIRAATVHEDIGSPLNDRVRPGMAAALKGDVNSTVWKNPRFGNQDTMYVNVPVRKRDRTVGAVRVAYTLTEIQENLGRIRLTLFLGIALYALLIVWLTIYLAGSLARPIEKLNRDALQIAGGDLDHRVHVNGTEEISHLADTLNYTTQRLQQLENIRRQFVSNVSHELRTPLAAIRSMAETLIQHGEKDPALREKYLPRIVTATDRLARLASQLLDLAQIESGNLVLYPAPISLASIVDDALRTCAPAAAAKGINIVTDVPPALPELHGDRDRLVQVFINLLDNAVRCTDSSGQITIAARSPKNALIVTVSDTGEGIAPEHLPHIFERFYRVDKARSRRSGGTGLGLSIVQQIVEAHGGSIAADSVVGQGTRFTITFPLTEPSFVPLKT
jgi:signal transduction histidine kinase